MKKIAVVVGHNPVQKGAYARKPLSTSEYPFNLSVANRMLELSADEDFDIKVITRAYVGSYRRNKNRKTRSAATVEIRAAYKEVQEYNPDYSMELHFNGHSSKRAVGSEVLSSGSRGSVRFAKVCQAIQADTFRHRGRRNRGIKFPKRGQRGHLSLHAASAPAIIVEPFFGSNPSDARKAFDLGVEGIAQMYIEVIKTLLVQDRELGR